MTTSTTAGEIMSSNVFSLKADASVIDAVRLLIEHDITGIPIIDDQDMLVGIISEKDVLQLFYKDETLEGKTVNDVMSQPAIHFEKNESITGVCQCLASYDFRRVPVTSGGRVVGIITRRDVIVNLLGTQL